MEVELKISPKIFNNAYYPYLFDYSKRYEIYYGSAGSGKSVFVAQKLVIKALRSPRRILVIRKVMATQKDSCWKTIIDILSQFKIFQYCKINKSTFSIELPNGSQFLFKGIDEPEKIKSIAGITDIWCEEATELLQEDADQLDLRLRASASNLQMFFSFNPISKANWVYKRWFADGAYIDDKTMILKTTYLDNRFLPQEYISSLEAMKHTNPTYFRIYALGEFASLDKLVYQNWTVEEFNHSAIVGELLVGLDFGFVNDTSALVASILDEANKKIYIFKEWGATNKTNDEIAEVIKSLGFTKSTIVADSAEQKSIEEIKRCGIQRIRACTKGPDSIIHGIQKVQQYQLIIHPSCCEIITELQNYSWQKDKKSNEYINKPIDDFNHYLDALRYSLQCVNSNKIKTMSKSAFGL